MTSGSDNKMQGDDSSTVELPSCSDISCAEKFLSELKLAFTVNKNLLVDASKVEKLTTPIVQLIVSAAEACKDGGSLKILNPSENLQKVFADLGLDSQLNEWKA